MRWRASILWPLSLALGGCIVSQVTPTPEPGTVGSVVGGGASSLNIPAVVSGRVRVRFVNESPDPAATRVTMRVLGQLVRLVERRVEPAGATLVVGPDFADSVVTEVTVLAATPYSLPIGSFSLGRDFHPGDEIVITIPAPPSEPPPSEPPPSEPPPSEPPPSEPPPSEPPPSEPPPSEPPPSEPPPAPTLSIEGLTADVRVNAGTGVHFALLAANFSAAARVSALADPDADGANGNEIPIISQVVPSARLEVTWDTSGLTPGLYRVAATLTDGDARVNAAPPAGRVRINAPPSLVVSAPRDQLAVTRGRPFVIAWAGQDDDDNATITVFLDDDDVFDNGVIVIRTAAEDDVNDRQQAVSTDDLTADGYFVGASISDGLSTVVKYAGRICLRERRVGRFAAADFADGEHCTIVGDALSGALGSALDASRDLNGDGFADLLIGDPSATSSRGAVSGAAHYVEGVASWPAALNVDELPTRMESDADGAQIGAAVALVQSTNGDEFAELLVGTPGAAPGGAPAGRALLLNGRLARNLSTLDLENLPQTNAPPGGGPSPQRGRFVELIDGTWPESAGAAVAGVGDLNGDGYPDYAVGAPFYGELREGRAGLIAGGKLKAPFTLDQLGGGVAGVAARGAEADGAAGAAIAAAGDWNQDEFSDVMIAAPGAGDAAGVVYLVFGARGLLDAGENFLYLGDVGASVPGVVLRGSAPGELSGAALASADVDGDGRADLLIGAPGHAADRGRVYVIYSQPLPAVVDLAQVGGTIAGAVVDGAQPGDRFGAAVASADLDGDGYADLVVGAPGAEAARGAVYVIYGGQDLAGVSLLDIPSCGLDALYLVGDAAGSRLGAAVSAGDLNGDGKCDVAAGSPDAAGGGRVELLFTGAP